MFPSPEPKINDVSHLFVVNQANSTVKLSLLTIKISFLISCDSSDDFCQGVIQCLHIYISVVTEQIRDYVT